MPHESIVAKDSIHDLLADHQPRVSRGGGAPVRENSSACSKLFAALYGDGAIDILQCLTNGGRPVYMYGIEDSWDLFLHSFVGEQ